MVCGGFHSRRSWDRFFSTVRLAYSNVPTVLSSATCSPTNSFSNCSSPCRWLIYSPTKDENQNPDLHSLYVFCACDRFLVVHGRKHSDMERGIRKKHDNPCLASHSTHKPPILNIHQKTPTWHFQSTSWFDDKLHSQEIECCPFMVLHVRPR